MADDADRSAPVCFEVIVGNIGTVYSGNMREALKHYAEYCSQSRAGYGRASHEPVTLMKDGEPWREYLPKWWLVDEMGAVGPYTCEDEAISVSAPEQSIIIADTAEAAAAAFRRKLKEGE